MPDPGLLRKQTLRNYDYSWGRLDGDPDMRSEFWRNNVADFLATQELCISPDWFRGRKVLDAGCGGGRWTYGLQKLGCEVTAFDASAAAVEHVRSNIAEDPARIHHANIFELPPEITDQRYDLVFSWGVLHHTGDTFRALSTIAPLMKPDGVLYVYLYGKRSWSPLKSFLVKASRVLLFPLPAGLKFSLFRVLLGEYKAGLAMDVLGSTIAHRYSQEEVDGWLGELGAYSGDVVHPVRRKPSTRSGPFRPLVGA
ncbi:MAG: class I SAM-dependent methyltransferase [Gemmatimonadetes bacterium]|nr:class I SAM-dependent methyltransferase [Gemmatimonadota bacterium]